jgi:hypothetical protein
MMSRHSQNILLSALFASATVATPRDVFACDNAYGTCSETDNTSTLGGGQECVGSAIEGTSNYGTAVVGLDWYGGTGVLGMSSGVSGAYSSYNTGIGVYGISGYGSDYVNSGNTLYDNSLYCRKGGELQVYNATVGVLGQSRTGSSNSLSYGVYGSATGTGAIGVYGKGDASGIKGGSTSGYGVYGFSTSNYGVYGTSTSKDGMHGEAGDGWSGVAGENSGSGNGVYASSNSGYGLYATSNSSFGVYATSNSWYGVYGQTNNTSLAGVWGQGGFYGVVAQGSSYGLSANGHNAGAYGYGLGASSIGVWGACDTDGCVAVYASGDLDYTGGLNHISDERLKKDIEPLEGSIDQLLRLRGVSFHWRDPETHGGHAGIQRGFVAQEYEKVFPEWVTTGRDGFKMISTDGLDALEVESIRTLKAENDSLKARVKALEEAGRPVISTNTNGLGFGIGGLALALGVVVVTKRKRDERSAQ